MARQNMPSREPRPEKVQDVSELVELLRNSSGTVLADYRSMTVKTISDLRNALRAQGASCHVAKNTLLKRAAGETGHEALEPWLEGLTAAIFFQGDFVPQAKALVDFIRTNANKPVIKGGLVEGRAVDLAGVRALAELPPREILLAMLVGTLQVPAGGLLATLQAAMSQLVGTLNSLEEQKGAASA